MPICVIFNPVAKGGKARRFRQSLDTIGSKCALQPTREAGEARALAAQAVRSGFDTLVAAGGDGTLNEVINGMGDEPEGFQRVKLGVLPLGTVNVFARELRLPANLERAWQVILAGRETRLDLARIEWPGGPIPRRRYFAQMAGAGLDARAIELVQWKLKQRFGWFAYVLAAAQAIKENQPEIHVAADGITTSGELVLLGNGRYYGGNYSLFPAAKMDDGLLDVLVLRKANWPSALRCLWGALSGRLHRQRGFEHRQTASLQLTSATKVACHVDGEWAGHLPCTAAIQSCALRVVVPEV